MFRQMTRRIIVEKPNRLQLRGAERAAVATLMNTTGVKGSILHYQKLAKMSLVEVENGNMTACQDGHASCSDDDDLLDDILAHGLQPLTSSPNDSLLDRISTASQATRRFFLELVRIHRPEHCQHLVDSVADRITNSIRVDEEIIPAASQQSLVSTLSTSDSSLTNSAAESMNNSITVDEEMIDILT
jgi:hypothetical protein